MGVPAWEVGYTSAIPRREDNEFRQGHVEGIGLKKIIIIIIIIIMIDDLRTKTSPLSWIFIVS